MPPSLADTLLSPLAPPPRLAVRFPLGLGQLLSVGRREGQRYLLLLRFALINLVALALIAAVWLQGWLDEMIRSDTTHLCALIGLVFLLGLGRCGRRVMQTSVELNELRAGIGSSPVAALMRDLLRRDAASRAALVGALRIRLANRIAGVRYVANTLVLLGLIGTVVGFIMALGGVDPETAADVESIAPMVTKLVGGMSVALYTTLVGSVLNIWLMVNYRLLESGTVKLLTAVVEQGECHGRA
jgi:hypothetical protein